MSAGGFGSRRRGRSAAMLRRRSGAWATSGLLALAALTLGGGPLAHAATIPAAHPLSIGRGGSVASMDGSASRAGIAVLRAGGDAVDAAVATASALGVSVPFVAGPGGGGFMIIYDAHTHRVTTIDGRETCPAACTRKLFLDARGKPLGYDMASDQPLSTGVPGMVAQWQTAVARDGRHRLAADLGPAIALARRGFLVDRDFRQLTASDLPELRAYPASRALLLTRRGNPLPLGHRLRDPDLADTYALIAAHGTAAFYRGPIGRAIVAAVDAPILTPGQQIVRLRGQMTPADLAAYRTRVLAPTRVGYAGLTIDGVPPPSSSGTTVSEALDILSDFDLAREPRATALFRYLEASRLAYADRDRYVGDPDFVHVPVAALTSVGFGDARACLIDRLRALRSPLAPGDPFGVFSTCSPVTDVSEPTSASPEHDETNNIVTTDRWGDVVAYTNTINFFGGSGEVVPGYGFLLNDELTDFDFAPIKPSVPDPNLPGPRKEPRSSMGPVIAVADGTPQFAIGAAGGSTIPETILQTLIGHVDFGMSLPAALAAPRVAQTNTPTSEAEPAFYESRLRHELQTRFGERFSLATGPILPLDHYPGDATAVQMLGGGRVESIAEPRRLYGGSALTVRPSR